MNLLWTTKSRMLSKAYPYRFECFLFTLICILFGSLVIPGKWFDQNILPLLLFLNIGAGIILISKKKFLVRLLFLVLALVIGVTVTGLILDESRVLGYSKLILYFLFYGLVTVEIIQQVWRARVVGKNVILGLISGYISLGLLAFFICMTIEIVHPNSFSGIHTITGLDTGYTEQLMYFSYITLMTIGYGDILPVSPIAQKATIFIGLTGQFYLVILTAIVVGKYINQQSK